MKSSSLWQRPHLMVGAVVWCALALALAGCGRSLHIDEPNPAVADAEACQTLISGLPDTLGDHDRREVKSRYVAAYGDPAVIIRCGVTEPVEFGPLSSCQRINGVDWFVPDNQIADAEATLVATTVGRTPQVELTIPPAHRPPDAELVDLSNAIKSQTRSDKPCV